MRRAAVLLALLASACAGARLPRVPPRARRRSSASAPSSRRRTSPAARSGWGTPRQGAGHRLLGELVRPLQGAAASPGPARAEEGGRGLEVYGVAFDEDRALVEAFLVDTPVSLILWDRAVSDSRRRSRSADCRRPSSSIVQGRPIRSPGLRRGGGPEARGRGPQAARGVTAAIRAHPAGSRRGSTSEKWTRSRSRSTSPASAGDSRSQYAISSASQV